MLALQHLDIPHRVLGHMHLNVPFQNCKQSKAYVGLTVSSPTQWLQTHRL